jgi:Tol biopolymer transport system component
VAFVLSGGARPQIARDGVRVAITQSIDPDSNSALQVYDTSTKVLRAVPNARGAETFAWASGGSLYFSKDATGTTSGWIGVANSNLTKGSLVASLPVSNPQFSAGQLFPSPDGSKVLFALTGDDGYSRIQMLDASTKKLTPLSPLYDETPIGWLLDGSAVLFIRGNADQQEKTSLFRMKPDGTHRTELVKSASI